LKTILKIVVAVVILNAVYRGGVATYTYFELKDEVERLLRFDNVSTPEELEAMIVTLGTRLGAPLDPAGVSIDREGSRTSASVSYTASVEFFPRYTYATPVSFSVDVFSVGPLPPGSTPR